MDVLLSKQQWIHAPTTSRIIGFALKRPWDAWPYYGNNNWKILPEHASPTDPDAREDVRTKKSK
jgi:hypothetical protein